MEMLKYRPAILLALTLPITAIAAAAPVSEVPA